MLFPGNDLGHVFIEKPGRNASAEVFPVAGKTANRWMSFTHGSWEIGGPEWRKSATAKADFVNTTSFRMYPAFQKQRAAISQLIFSIK
ncbi:hypothetical protein JOC94_002755 [Bacillus thermophilus]|uniref:Uncharacterized protein n=1 Tax=Siminovitchia thermophila TaxID=1245522 RepID=A0ABS2R7X6_9BACI|nr:hypothetical protein [Siminovitchia thermophila]ONK23573.1 hypothetical protein BLX87_10140 [Bacillus sp. VT-16-64]